MAKSGNVLNGKFSWNANTSADTSAKSSESFHDKFCSLATGDKLKLKNDIILWARSKKN